MTERENEIIALLYSYGELSIQEISDLLGVSSSTIRRDLIVLGEHRFIERTRGGVRLSTAIHYDPLPIYKLPVAPQEARAIANRAVGLIERGDVIAVSGGQICTQLALRIRHLEGVTVVTNAINVAIELVALPGIHVMLSGGQLNAGSFELVGQAVNLSLNGVHIHKFFLGTDGLSVEHGVTGHDEAEAMAARAILEHSDATIVLADSPKFKKPNFAQVASMSAINVIVTTDRVPESIRALFEEAGAQVIVAPCP